ncbi:MAG: isoleucine--tRNA ligase [Lentisphaeria bacterium]|nr:isoleucine--tRNA ligase [Lentisphaeria bacterium]
MFKARQGQMNFPRMEEEVLAFWKQNGTFAKSLENRKGKEEFVFYDGPPFATGLPHYGHLLAGTIKDVVPRYQTMRGKYCERTFGWDCHGLPVEYEMEKQLNLSGKKEIEDYGIDKFNEACRSIVLRYTSEWKEIVTRMGRWVDFENGYRTMDLTYMESIWNVFKQLWDKGLIYEGYKVLPYCARCSTPLSNFEANQGYKEVTDPTVTIRFKLKGEENTYILALTTTPWTLPSNMALAFGPDVDYVKVKDGDVYYILARARLSAYYKKDEMPEIVSSFKGREMAGKRYEPLFPYFLGEKAKGGYLVKGTEYQQVKEGFDFVKEGAYQVITADYVSTEDGTGVVHIAPLFGEDDCVAGKAFGIPAVCPVDAECRFTSEITDYTGLFVKDADKPIMERLKAEGKLVARSSVKHSYPHCWRDDSPLIYKAVTTWFVKIDPIKQKMLNANSRMTWVPAHIKEGRFGKWLENARDWAISRNRYWGCPLPIWRNEETGETICVGSVAELEKLTGKKITDIHKHFVDDLEIRSASGAVLRRVPEVLDCWFESGSMPYAQKHYPFENKERFEKCFPADFIAEGLDQTRGWFYTLVVMAAALFDKPPALHVIVNGLILAENGQKMSKRLKNYPDPGKIVDTYGADALRLFLLGSPVVRAEDLKFSEEGIKEVMRGVMLPIWNSFSFFTTYANVDNWTPAADGKCPEKLENPLDRWILSSLADMVEEVRASMDDFQLQKAANRFEQFAEDLTNWYIRRSRRRFWKSQNDSDKNEAYATLYYALLTFVKCAAPFIPFVTEEIYRTLRTDSMPESVHLCDYPEAETWRRDARLEKQMTATRTAVSLGRFIRTQKNLKVRQVLAKAMIVSDDAETRDLLKETEEIIAEELNVKEIVLSSDEEELVTFSAKANFKALGPKLGPAMKEAASLIAKFSSQEIASIVRGTPRTITLSSGKEFQVTESDLAIVRTEKEGFAAATESGITIALDTTLSAELIEEGIAREFISKVQNMRKENDLEVSDRIDVEFSSDADVVKAVSDHVQHIAQEVLAVNVKSACVPEGAVKCDINGHEAFLFIRKA